MKLEKSSGQIFHRQSLVRAREWLYGPRFESFVRVCTNVDLHQSREKIGGGEVKAEKSDSISSAKTSVSEALVNSKKSQIVKLGEFTKKRHSGRRFTVGMHVMPLLSDNFGGDVSASHHS